MRHPLRLGLLTVTLYVFWMLMSGYFTAFLLTIGFCSALAVALLAARMETADPDHQPGRVRPDLLAYLAWLVREIWTSAITVSRIIIDPALPVSPTLVRFRPSQQTAIGITTHANSITLTPGTITVEASHEEFVVHGLTRASALATIDSDMDRRVRRLEPGS